jgi:acetoacetyl-CoA synthetase
MERGEVLWEPPSDAVETTRMGRFMRAQGFDDPRALHRWSTGDVGGFWAAATAELGVDWVVAPTETLAGGPMPDVRWFPGAELNYAQHALRQARSTPGAVAVVARSQTVADQELTWAELAAAVASCAAGLRALGVGRGDRVAAYAPNIPETLVAFLATASLGAIWSSCAPEFGTPAVVDRFAQIEPKVLLAVDGYRYGTKTVDRLAEHAVLRASLPSLEHLVPLRYLGTGDDGWTGLLAEAGTPAFEPVPFDHPLYVLYSSGTTGRPKAIVHGHGGITVEHMKALALHHDLGPADRFCWFTTTGWMMWNLLVSGLLVGSSIVLFDGDPAAPDLNTLWRLADDTECTGFGVSAGFIMNSRKAGLAPAAGRMRWLGSTGSPLPAEGFHWVRDVLGAGVPVASISGGTDVCSAFVGAHPLLPVRAGEITAPLLGCKVEAWDAQGRACPPGQRGELMVTAPMPSMPVGLWGDDAAGSRYRSSYFEPWPGVWRHGDWITFADDGASVISGRSDATLNRGGVRLGTAELYAVVEALPEVDDSLVVHLDDGDDDRLVLFVRLASGVSLDDTLRQSIAKGLRSTLSPRHVPDEVVATPSIPRTLSGKKLEVPVKRILAGAPAAQVASPESLAEPASLDWYVSWRSRSGVS